MRKTQKGFTLIELSIVLVIIGLIVGGVLVGRDLIYAAQIRGQIKQFDEFIAATNTFKVKYNYLPGDMPPSEANQNGFFTMTGALAGGSYVMPTGGALVGAKMGWGNNDGAISNIGEIYVYWRHLSQANLIMNAPTGDTATNYLRTDASTWMSNGGVPQIMVNEQFLPKAKLKDNTYINVSEANTYTGKKAYTGTSKINVYTMDLATTPRQKYLIDEKIDDGMPDTGTVRDWDQMDFLGFPGTPCGTGTPKAYRLDAASADTIPGACMFSILW